MRLLLDECLPRPLVREITGHEVRTVGQEGWKGVKNGALLRLAAEAGFDAFITVDRKLPYQQKLAEAPIGVLLLRAHSNHLDVVKALIPEMLDALVTLDKGEVRVVGA